MYLSELVIVRRDMDRKGCLCLEINDGHFDNLYFEKPPLKIKYRECWKHIFVN